MKVGDKPTIIEQTKSNMISLHSETSFKITIYQRLVFIISFLVIRSDKESILWVLVEFLRQSRPVRR